MNELKRGMFNKRMLLACFVGLLVIILEAYDNVLEGMTFANLTAPDLVDDPDTQQWLYETGHNKYTIWMNSLFFLVMVLPLLSVFSYSASFLEERNSHFHYFIQMRKSFVSYIRGKYIAVALTGGLAILIPHLIFYMAISIFFINDPNPAFIEGSVNGPFSTSFSFHPEAYIWLTFLTHFLLGACFASIALCLSSFVKKAVIVYVAPFFIFAIWEISFGFLNLDYYMSTSWYDMDMFADPIRMSLSFLTIFVATYTLFTWKAKEMNAHG
ncbi:hypothetical protein MM221_05005 [Salipaludibacillus sp. LMS25]|jgi:hypothetical protein|uniref:ABC transporter permease n=1 Tax=Salipaludibacillus sp. LMS25 TaxID=2924031 RepID=UPI0020D0065C|nr:ABC transporter permease [Salipaludibacillus sp. LMS25]UTR15922.1 hypothetical protein MM221_05005 [Salipaludibacillus sp. LMS25]